MSLFRLLQRHLADPDSHHGAIARGFLWVSLFALLGRLAGAGKEVAIAYRYGVAAEVDAYVFIFSLLTWPVGVWFSVLTVVLVPVAASVRRTAPAELPQFRAELLGFTLMLGLALSGLAWLGMPWLLQSVVTGLPERTSGLAQGMAGNLLPIALLGTLVSLFSAWMLASGRHANTLLESVPALVLLLVLLLVPDSGAAPLVWGTLAGFGLHLAGLVALQARHGEVELPRWGRRSRHWATFWPGFGVMLAGQMLMGLAVLADQFFAARMSTGAIAELGYANRILALALGMGAMAVSRATLPVFSQAQLALNEQMRRVAAHWSRIMAGLGAAATVVGWWLAPLVVGLLFERGAFTARDTAVVAEVLRHGLVQLPFYFAAIVFVSLLASQGRHRTIAAAAAIGLLVKIGAMALLTPLLGVNGIVLASSIMYATILLWFCVDRGKR